VQADHVGVDAVAELNHFGAQGSLYGLDLHTERTFDRLNLSAQGVLYGPEFGADCGGFLTVHQDADENYEGGHCECYGIQGVHEHYLRGRMIPKVRKSGKGEYDM
jgi:hypothetical protein